MGDKHLKLYIGTVAVLGAALGSGWLYRFGLGSDPSLLVGTALFAALITLGVALSVRIGEHTYMGIWDVWLVLAVVAVGPSLALLAALPSSFVVGRKDWLRTFYDVGQNAVTVHLAGLVFSYVSAPLLVTGGAGPAAPIFYGTLAAGATVVLANEAVDGGLLRVKYGQPLRETWEENWQPYLASDAVNVATAGLGVLAFVAYGPVAAIVTVVGSIGSQALVYRSREHVGQNRELRERVASLEKALANSNATFGTMMVQEMGRKDGYTHRHATATSVYAADLAREVKLDDGRVERLCLAGLLHNIGMFGLPEELLMSAGRLNSVAQHQVAEHPVRGQAVLGAVPEYAELASWVRWHHERPDGRGYPDKLRGPWIPLEAKILAVAQAYAEMVLDGPQRPGVDPAAARRELGAGAETLFDGMVVRAFLRLLDTESEGYRMADDHRFAFPAPDDREDAGSGGEPDGGRGRAAVH